MALETVSRIFDGYRQRGKNGEQVLQLTRKNISKSFKSSSLGKYAKYSEVPDNEFDNWLSLLLGQEGMEPLDEAQKEEIKRQLCECLKRIDESTCTTLWEYWLRPVLNPVSALLVVDVQNDFITGSLALKNCPAGEDGEEVVSVIEDLLSKRLFSVVAYSYDWHPPDHCSFVDNVSLYPLHSTSPVSAEKAKLFDVVVYDKIPIIDQVLWPRHCEIDSWGAKLHKKLTACCALYEDGSWYRGLVVSIQSMDNIEVFYVDYGNTARLPLSSLRVLRSQFIKFPAQALPSKLAYVEPFDGGDEWSPAATHRFYHLTKNYKYLVGLVCGVKEGVLSLCLCDTNANEDLHINDELVAGNFAICPEINSPAASSPDGQDHDRRAEPQQNLASADFSLLTPEQQMYLNQNAINVQSLLHVPADLPTYPQDITSWVNQTAQYTNHLMNLHPNQSNSGLQVVSDTLCHDDLDFMEQINQELQELELDSVNQGAIKRISLAHDYSFHVINFEKTPYVISAEISALFWDSDLLRSMLRQKKKTVAKVVVSFSENKELFEVLIRCKVPGVADGDEPRSFVTLYELEGLPEILRTFDHPSEELLSHLLDEIDCFKREGENYWISKEDKQPLGSETGSSSEDQFSETDLGIDELQLLLQAMQFRRKRILQGLMTGDHCTNSTGGTVDELHEVEMQIEGLRQEILQKELKIAQSAVQ